ncbi:hypothetical protein niasHT_025563 [Heterodera trifolii]|uniref:BTB domain-containing protein n=1 Tax=Heterodera trifolii TaxID=157864 RepID=A0ABD2K899_9BILA
MSSAGNLADRMKLLFESGENADVYFLVGEGDRKELFPAHKLILGTASDVFKTMFRYDDYVEVNDIQPVVFRAMLEFIYTDNLGVVNGNNAMAVLYAANKYDIKRLVNQCVQIPFDELTDVFFAVEAFRLFGFEDLTHRCWRYICQNAAHLFKSEAFLQIDQNLLAEFFKRDRLEISDELELWQAALRWADEKCCQNGKECSAVNRREMLGSALFNIRFPLIQKVDFTKHIAKCGVLVWEEVLSIYQFHCHPIANAEGQEPLPFATAERCVNWNIARENGGTLALEIDNFTSFAAAENSWRSSFPTMHIIGLPWQIFAHISQDNGGKKWLGFYLQFAAKNQRANWSCKCSATLRILSHSNEDDLMMGYRAYVFNNEKPRYGWQHFVQISELMDPINGFYNEDEDKVTLAIDLTLEKERGNNRWIPDQ